MRYSPNAKYLAICGAIGGVGLTVLLSAVVHAWKPVPSECSWYPRWEDSRTTMYLDTRSFPPGGWGDRALQDAMWQWNNVRGSKFQFFVNRNTDGTADRYNGYNEVFFTTDRSYFGEKPDSLALAKIRWKCTWVESRGRIIEADVAFNANYSWTRDWDGYPTTHGHKNFRSVALHEFGHVLGLAHDDRWLATMNTYYPHGGPVGNSHTWTPLGDDRLGVRYLYPESTTERDLAASAIRFSGTGPYARNARPSRTTVQRGDTVTIEYTFLNLGTYWETFDHAFYLSTNDYISSYDTRIASGSGAWADPGFVGSYSRTLRIPNWISPGTYYLGYIVDYNNKVPERDGSNNAVALLQPIRIY